ncbi:MAG: TetR/AcrR family transcriptional regulator [Mycobacterium sp.]|nr:TetR/AcrR family transcriptional regulator [Mycobacterium sp.]
MILSALRGLLDEFSIADISVHQICRHAAVTRPGFYFYFDSKYSALAELLHEHSAAIDTRRFFRRRQPGESRSALITRIIQGISLALASENPISASGRSVGPYQPAIAATLSALETTVTQQIVTIIADEMLRGARPITTDIPALIQALTTATAVSCDPAQYGKRAHEQTRARAAVAALWHNSLWPRGGSVSKRAEPQRRAPATQAAPETP